LASRNKHKHIFKKLKNEGSSSGFQALRQWLWQFFSSLNADGIFCGMVKLQQFLAVCVLPQKMCYTIAEKLKPIT